MVCTVTFVIVVGGQKQKEASKLQIVVANDSLIEAKKGIGGFEAQNRVHDSLWTVNHNTFFLDAGDMFQVLPYFNLSFERVEVERDNL